MDRADGGAERDPMWEGGCRQDLLGEDSALESLPTHLLGRDPQRLSPLPCRKG